MNNCLNMQNKTKRKIWYWLYPLVFIIFIIWKIYKACREFHHDMQEWFDIYYPINNKDENIKWS